MRRIRVGILVLLIAILGLGCSDTSTNEVEQTTEVVEESEDISTEDEEPKDEESLEEESVEEPSKEEVPVNTELGYSVSEGILTYQGINYTVTKVEGGDRSGTRLSNVAVDIGFGDRMYWALTNEYGQLVYVLADTIILQDDNIEPVNSDGRYYNDEAEVPGTEQENLDQGHVIADSMGGVANAYNITPQESTLNRHGDQAYMEDSIRKANGCTNFVATITYPSSDTQIPSRYKYEYVLMGSQIVDEFDNINPEPETNAVVTPEPEAAPVPTSTEDVSAVDTNGNGKVTIAEAEAAGYSMPIYADHWLYPYMDDRDGDGMVGE